MILLFYFNSMKIISVIILLLPFLLFIMDVSGQDIEEYGPKRRDIFPIWSYHYKNVNIHGIALGIWSIQGEPRQTNTNGLKLELLGVGIGMPLIPRSPIVESDSQLAQIDSFPLSERINGINISATGSSCECLTNGIVATTVGQFHYQVNGLSVAFINFVQIHNGLMIGGMTNDVFRLNGVQIALGNGSRKANGVQIGAFNNADSFNGLQIGLINTAENCKGLQIGLWNVNQHRKWPLINWSHRQLSN
jgi:hypothetical protein